MVLKMVKLSIIKALIINYKGFKKLFKKILDIKSINNLFRGFGIKLEKTN